MESKKFILTNWTNRGAPRELGGANEATLQLDVPENQKMLLQNHRNRIQRTPCKPLGNLDKRREPVR